MRTKEKSFTLLLLMLLATAILMMTSCRKDDEPEEPKDQPVGMISALGQLKSTLINYTLFC